MRDVDPYRNYFIDEDVTWKCPGCGWDYGINDKCSICGLCLSTCCKGHVRLEPEYRGNPDDDVDDAIFMHRKYSRKHEEFDE